MLFAHLKAVLLKRTVFCWRLAMVVYSLSNGAASEQKSTTAYAVLTCMQERKGAYAYDRSQER